MFIAPTVELRLAHKAFAQECAHITKLRHPLAMFIAPTAELRLAHEAFAQECAHIINLRHINKSQSLSLSFFVYYRVNLPL